MWILNGLFVVFLGVAFLLMRRMRRPAGHAVQSPTGSDPEMQVPTWAAVAFCVIGVLFGLAAVLLTTVLS